MHAEPEIFRDAHGFFMPAPAVAEAGDIGHMLRLDQRAQPRRPSLGPSAIGDGAWTAPEEPVAGAEEDPPDGGAPRPERGGEIGEEERHRPLQQQEDALFVRAPVISHRLSCHARRTKAQAMPRAKPGAPCLTPASMREAKTWRGPENIVERGA